MFTHAIDVATRFTNPFVGLRRRANGDVFTTMGAFVVVNEEGWVLTSGHIVDEILGHQNGVDGADEGAAQEGSVTSHSELWAVPGFMNTKPHLAEAHRQSSRRSRACVAWSRSTPTRLRRIPIFRDISTAPIAQGMSVCRLGFPFCDVPATFRRRPGRVRPR